MNLVFIKSNQIKGFTLIELMIVVAMLGILATIAEPFFSSYMLRSKTSEAATSLAKMVEGEIKYYHNNNSFISAGPINIPPSPSTQVLDFSTDPNWSEIDFEISGGAYYGYEAVSTVSNAVDCSAVGDLNGDGVTSLFRRSVTAAGEEISAGSLYFFDELE